MESEMNLTNEQRQKIVPIGAGVVMAVANGPTALNFGLSEEDIQEIEKQSNDKNTTHHRRQLSNE